MDAPAAGVATFDLTISIPGVLLGPVAVVVAAASVAAIGRLSASARKSR